MVRPFTIYVMQSAHTDIGYTHSQEQIMLMYLDHYDHVLELCRKSEHEPIAHRFKWTCETSWQVRHYLEARPEREEEFLYYVRNGQIEITASFLHFTDMVDTDAYRRSLEWVLAYCKQHKLPLRCALHSDINGWPWGLADVLSEANIPYFCSQIHIDSATDPLGKRGSVHYFWLLEQGVDLKQETPFRIPQAFLWQGPQGGKVLHWLGEHYLQGNVLGLSSSKGFAADKTGYFTETDQVTAEELYASAKVEVPRYLERLIEAGYPYDSILLSTGGFYVDNAPPDERWCRIIKQWNKDHEEIQIRTATLGEWFEVLAQKQQESLPTYKVAWPDHWAHGLGSLTTRIAQARRTQRRRADVVKLVDQADSKKAAEYLTTALQQEQLALEHTFNAWSTTARPSSSFNEFVQSTKELNFHRAEFYLDEAVGSALRQIVPESNEQPQLYVGVSRSGDGKRIVHFAADDLQLNPEQQILTDLDGERYPFQRDSQELSRFIAVLPLKERDFSSFSLMTAQTQSVASEARTELSTRGWHVRVDPISGGLLSLKEQVNGKEWVDLHHQHVFGQLVQEAIVHPQGLQMVGNTGRFMALDTASDSLRRRIEPGQVFEYSTLQIIGSPQYRAGSVFDTIQLTGKQTRIGKVQISWRAYHAIPVVELVLDWYKTWSDQPEAAYVAFPFAAQGGQLELETGGGFFQPGSFAEGGQLPGTCSTYYTIQQAARISAASGEQLFWLPLDAPLVMPNEINYARWEATEPWDWNGFLASMPVNHYWHTNFATSQRGYLRLRYRFVSPSALNSADSETIIQTGIPSEAYGWR
ncbi:hypothetical protein [Tengunoibacter tsumagoiensis]|uniref:Glycoside hydrolase family 38 N-terminal domain-containing protein n=1 Tax=Tengunoibacter tsumagoiensis TaxID=2014871 RepID=A0A402A4I6_9CHLR|nr:hypothetical protein [Tengunoibacter tsumagoiensis]GCE14022.1 hypothetical protein KTT_38810 [Tengunoibacter tsumagoiensis]